MSSPQENVSDLVPESPADEPRDVPVGPGLAGLLARRLIASNAKDDAESIVKMHDDELKAIDDQIRVHLEADGSWAVGCGAKIPGLSVRVGETATAVYDKEKWDDIARWAFESGNHGIINRAIGAAKLEKLVESGVALPDGLQLLYFKKLNFRRS